MEESKLKEQEEETEEALVEIDSDADRLIKSLNLQIDPKKNRIVANLDNFEKEIQNIKASSQTQDFFSVESDFLGIKLVSASHKLGFTELKNQTLESLNTIINQTPTRIPLGVA